jgi:L-threonylcarbamoyladenylate synthase
MNNDLVTTHLQNARAYLVKPGGVIVVPTDTTYGVICQLNDDAAIDRIYDIKGRDRSKPLIILGSETSSLLQWIAAGHRIVETLADKFWPGALTIVAQASPAVPRSILSGGETVGIRIPSHEATLHLLSSLPSKSVASTSANPSGAGIPRDFAEVTTLMTSHVDYIVPDCNTPPAGTESTIIDITSTPPRILRSGALSAATILAAFES